MSDQYPPGSNQPPPQGPPPQGPPPQGPPPQGPPPGGYGTYPAPESSGPGGSNTGFFAALFDFSFNSFVTPKIVKFVYVLATVVLGLLFLVYLVIAFSADTTFGVVVLILGPIVTLIYLAFIRMTLEIYYAVVRMSEDIHSRLPR